MRRDFHLLPKEIREHGLDFHCDKQKLWALDIPTEEIDVSEIDWVFDLPFWSHGNGKYNLYPRHVLENIDLYREHKDRILKADTKYPIDVMINQDGRLEILDGLHCLVRLVFEGNKKVKVRKISREFIPFIEK